MPQKPIRTLFMTQSRIFPGAEVNLLSLLNTIDQQKISPFLCFNPLSGIHKHHISKDIPLIPLSPPDYQKKIVFW